MTRLPHRARALTLAAVLASVASLLVGAAAPAQASKPRVRLERLALDDGKLSAFTSVVELEGEVVENIGAGEFTLFVDDKAAGKAAAAQKFAQTSEEVYVAFVVEVAAQYKKAIDPVKEALKEFLEDQPRQFKAMLVVYGSETETRSALQPAAALTGPIDDLVCDDDSSDVKMVEAVRAAMIQLNALPKRRDGTLARRLIVLVSDGLNYKMDRDTFRKLGDEARKNKIPIHSLAWSPGDERGPLLNLGELSKRSNGTFRWAQKQEDLGEQLKNLAEEVRKQYVLGFSTKLDTLKGHRFKVCRAGLCSNRVAGDIFEADEEGGGGAGGDDALWKKWWFWVSLVFGLLVLLYVTGLIIQARQRRAAEGPAPQNRAATAPQPQQAKAAPAVKARAAAGGGGGGAAAPAAAAAGRAGQLIVIGGALGGSRFELRGVLTVGKGAGLSIIISDDPTVSTRHCELGNDGRGFYVKDLGSTNGTFVNNQRIAANAVHRLADSDIVRLGANTQFKVRID